jgi:hypothetical protein
MDFCTRSLRRAEAGEHGRSWNRDAWNRPARTSRAGPRQRRVLGEQEIAGVQAAHTHVLQDDGVARVQRNDRVIADLMACGPDSGEILEHATVELDTVIVPEIADGVVAEPAREVREYRGLTVCGARAATWNLSREACCQPIGGDISRPALLRCLTTDQAPWPR